MVRKFLIWVFASMTAVASPNAQESVLRLQVPDFVIQVGADDGVSPSIDLIEGQWRVGRPVYQLLTVVGHNRAAVETAIEGLPSWLQIVGDHIGVASSRAPHAGRVDFTVRGDDGASDPTVVELGFTVHPELTADTPGTISLSIGQDFSRALTASGIVGDHANWAWSIASAEPPDGLIVEGRELSGRIYKAGDYRNLVLSIEDSFDGQSDDTEPFRIIVTGPTDAQVAANIIAMFPTWRANARRINESSGNAYQFVADEGMMPVGVVPPTTSWDRTAYGLTPWGTYNVVRDGVEARTVRMNLSKVPRSLCLSFVTQSGLEHAWTYGSPAGGGTVNVPRSMTYGEASSTCVDGISVGIRYPA